MFRRVLVVCLVAVSAPAYAQVEKAIDASFTEGLAIDSSGIHRAGVGGALTFGRLGVQAGLGLQAWNRWQKDKGTRARGVDFGADVRFDLLGNGKQRGPYLYAGASFIRFVGDADKRVNSMLGIADIGPNGFWARGGIAYGFPTTKRITIAVKIEVGYWRIEGGDFPPEADDPHPNLLTFHIGLEFMRWM
jgi:hypothetical protein